ncbi:MAG: alkaline phosphatase [Thermoguttaceae bacterium]
MNRTHPSTAIRFARLLALAVVLVLQLAPAAPAAKNVILMIADGAGENLWLAAAMYQGRVGAQIYDQPGWARFSCSTYPLSLSHAPTGDLKQDPALIYDPLKAWDTTALGATRGFAGYHWQTTTPTDSAAAATALATGKKTYNHAINWSNDGRPMRGLSIAEIAKRCGKSVGVVTTVPWSDATPAALGGAHNVNRGNHAEIANEMLDGGWLDVIMGGGNPDFDDDGQPRHREHGRDYQWVGGRDTWKSLQEGKRAWKLVESKADFEALAAGPTPPKVLGTAQVGKALQVKRAIGRAILGNLVQHPQPFSIPLNNNVPSLAVLSRAAIHCLDDNPKGFYLMIEGGAVDWANHANQPERAIEEQVDFVRAVEAVVAWIESHGGWDQTLLILTADHECGLLWGPKSRAVPFDPIVDREPNRLPGMAYNSHGHSNSLVPIYARGPGSERFATFVKATDGEAAARWRISGRYLDNTDIFAVMRQEVTGTALQGSDGRAAPGQR